MLPCFTSLACYPLLPACRDDCPAQLSQRAGSRNSTPHQRFTDPLVPYPSVPSFSPPYLQFHPNPTFFSLPFPSPPLLSPPPPFSPCRLVDILANGETVNELVVEAITVLGSLAHGESSHNQMRNVGLGQPPSYACEVRVGGNYKGWINYLILYVHLYQPWLLLIPFIHRIHSSSLILPLFLLPSSSLLISPPSLPPSSSVPAPSCLLPPPSPSSPS